MARAYRYTRPAIRLEYYAESFDFNEQHAGNQPGTQPPPTRDLFYVHQNDTLDFAPGVPDIRGFAVNTPNGDLLGTVEAYLADGANSTVPYAYVKAWDDRTVMVPTSQFMIYADMKLVTLEGGKISLHGAPDATRDRADAERADHYWSAFRRQQAA